MRNILHRLALLFFMGVSLMLCGCGKTDVQSYAAETPVMAFDRFFSGPTTGHGIVQDRSGRVIRRFVVEMTGSWSGDQGRLDEHFTYSDGEKQHRTWNVRKLTDNSFTATAADIVGEARGESAGNAIRWNYVMTIPLEKHKVNIAFDDWMFMADDGLIINRSVMKKFGVRVGDITITIRKSQSLK